MSIKKRLKLKDKLDAANDARVKQFTARRIAPAQAELLAARAEAYHLARALRHGGDKLNKRGRRAASK